MVRPVGEEGEGASAEVERFKPSRGQVGEREGGRASAEFGSFQLSNPLRYASLIVSGHFPWPR